jgi:hypothetical protein
VSEHLDDLEKRLGVWLRAETFCVGIAVVIGFGYLVWRASQAAATSELISINRPTEARS